MAETPPTPEELALRRRARRRLVGAVALALLAVVILPMVFDSEPRPLGDKVDIRIPDQKTPFEPATVPIPAVTAPAEPLPPAAEVEQPEPRPEAPAVVKVEPAHKAEAKAQPTAKPETRPQAKPEPRPEAKPATAAAKPAETGAYYLQLGVFSSQANAAQMIAKAKAAGFKAASIQVGSQFRVRVGPVAERDKAIDYQAKLKAKGLDNVLVEP